MRESTSHLRLETFVSTRHPLFGMKNIHFSAPRKSCYTNMSPPYEIFIIFQKSRVRQEVASSELPEDHGKKKSNFIQSFFLILNDVVMLTDEVHFKSTTLIA